MLETFTPTHWLENFRVSKETFQYLCLKLKPLIARQNTQLRKCVSVEKRVAITLWCLATCSEYRTIAHLFGIAQCTVCEIVHDTCQAIVSALQKLFIKFPDSDNRQEVVDGFKSTWGMIQCVGSVDGCHIPVMPPALNHTDYYNRKGWYSIILQAVVDYKYIFRDICVGWPGSVHDARVFKNSGIYTKLSVDKILDGSEIQISDTTIPLFIIGDSAYPLSKFLMKPFAHNTALSPQQKTFNYTLSRSRIVVENAFGRLKARWRRLTKRNDMSLTHVPHIITSCCILHNICEMSNDAIPESWLNAEVDMDQPPTATTPEDTTYTSDATIIRNTLVDYYST